jgi:hypothetical protein
MFDGGVYWGVEIGRSFSNVTTFKSRIPRLAAQVGYSNIAPISGHGLAVFRIDTIDGGSAYFIVISDLNLAALPDIPSGSSGEILGFLPGPVFFSLR